MSSGELFDAPGTYCLRESPKALLVTAKDLGDKEVWIPKSVIHDDSEVYKKGDHGTLKVPMWFAEKEGWI